MTVRLEALGESVTVRLEALEVSHAELLFDGLCDARIYEFVDDVAPVSVEALRQRYARLVVGRSEDGAQVWLNWAIEVDGMYAGYVQATLTGELAEIDQRQLLLPVSDNYFCRSIRRADSA